MNTETSAFIDQVTGNCSADVKPQKYLWTREEYYKMAEANILTPLDRVELIEGEVIKMPSQNPPHSTSILIWQEILQNVFGSGFTIRPQLPLSLNLTSEPEPDIAVVRGSFRDYKTAHPDTALLVVEISDTTLAFDRREKASLYARAGIQEYWIVNLIEKKVEIHRDPCDKSDMPFGYGYGQIKFYKAGDTISPLSAPDAVISVDELFP